MSQNGGSKSHSEDKVLHVFKKDINSGAWWCMSVISAQFMWCLGLNLGFYACYKHSKS